jgi:hypothetical protein
MILLKFFFKNSQFSIRESFKVSQNFEFLIRYQLRQHFIYFFFLLVFTSQLTTTLR